MSYKHTVRDGNMVMVYHSNTPPPQKSFYKPLVSKEKELDGEEYFYYLVAVDNFAATMKKYGLGHLCTGHIAWCGPGTGAPAYFNKEQIDHFPKYMRRGGEYGHEPIKIMHRGDLPEWVKNKCKVHNIPIVYSNDYSHCGCV